MKALTVWQPWASLIAIGAKPYEFRRWPAPARMIGERIAVHAGVRKIKSSECDALVAALQSGGPQAVSLLKGPAIELLTKLAHSEIVLPLGAVIATARLSWCSRATFLLEGDRVANDSDRDDQFNFAWKLDEIEIVPPVPVRGMQGLWHWTP